ncbi:MAG: sulfite exporter TauE/SafE family protein [Mycobacteriaceae bacterium]
MSIVLAAAVALAVFGLASAAQAVTGFGSALVAVPLLTLAFGPVTAVLASTIVGLVLTAHASVQERAHVERRVAARLVVSGLIGLPLGYLVLTLVPARSLKLVIAAVLGVLVVVLAARLRLPSGLGAQRSAGVASGVLLTSTGMNGPPLVVLLQAMGQSPRRFRATLQVTFFAQDLAAVVLFLVTGLLSPAVWGLAAAGVLGVPLGWWLGDRLFGALSAARFRRVVLGGLAVLALTSLVTAVAG